VSPEICASALFVVPDDGSGSVRNVVLFTHEEELQLLKASSICLGTQIKSCYTDVSVARCEAVCTDRHQRVGEISCLISSVLRIILELP
jgi:hypothetical protein